MINYSYNMPAPPRLMKLHDELIAAGVPVISCQNATGSNQLVVVVPDGTAQGPITTVVNAHDPTTPGGIEQSIAQDATNLQTFKLQIGAAITALQSGGWDGLTAANRTNIMLLALRALLALARR